MGAGLGPARGNSTFYGRGSGGRSGHCSLGCHHVGLLGIFLDFREYGTLVIVTLGQQRGNFAQLLRCLL